MEKDKVLKEVKKIVREKLQAEFTGHDYWHCKRVVDLALKIGKKEKADLWVLKLAGWLHDIDVKNGRDNHHLKSAIVAAKILGKLKVDKKTINKVQECIKSHSYRGAKTNPARTIEAKIISDADKLDVMGAVGIARVCSFAGHFGRPLHDSKLKFEPEKYTQQGSKTAIGAYYEKIFFLPKVLYTKTAKEMGKKRLEFSKEFVKRFLDEWEGKR